MCSTVELPPKYKTDNQFADYRISKKSRSTDWFEGPRFKIAWPELSLILSLQIINSSRPQFKSFKNQRIQPNKNQPSGQLNRETNHGNVNCLVSIFQVPLPEFNKTTRLNYFSRVFFRLFQVLFSDFFQRISQTKINNEIRHFFKHRQ